ncbi:MAG: alpha-amylase, partial [Nitratireductor sp.]|nr:alpha-amylase [Nitratireductor sp.]
MENFYANSSEQLTATPTPVPKRLREGLQMLLRSIYPAHDQKALLEQTVAAFWPDGEQPKRRGRAPANTLWSERDSYVITYGNTFVDGVHKPLDLLYDFLDTRLKNIATGVHILPYFPYTSDDGFAITDYYAVDSGLGAWEDIGRIAGNFRLMSDLVINHCSSQSTFFNEYLLGHVPYDRFFFEASPE